MNTQAIEESTQVDIEAEIDGYLKKWQNTDGNLIMILHAIQDKHSYVPRDLSILLAEKLKIPLARIYEVLTFYHYFKLVCPGKHTVSVCNGTACYIKGSTNLLESLENELGIKEGQTTADREFHLETVRCIGCCGLSPAMVIDGKTYGKVKSSDISSILNAVRTGEE